jgi:hypothetical protein
MERNDGSFNEPAPVENPALQTVLMTLELRDAIGNILSPKQNLNLLRARTRYGVSKAGAISDVDLRKYRFRHVARPSRPRGSSDCRKSTRRSHFSVRFLASSPARGYATPASPVESPPQSTLKQA